MKRVLPCVVTLALAVAFPAVAQERAAQPANPTRSAAPPATDANATTTMFKAGMVVKDSAGATVGKITHVGKTGDGAATVAVNVDGKTVSVPVSSLSLNPAGDAAVSTMTKTEIKAAAPAKPS
jgi:hypothetical protein